MIDCRVRAVHHRNPHPLIPSGLKPRTGLSEQQVWTCWPKDWATITNSQHSSRLRDDLALQPSGRLPS